MSHKYIADTKIAPVLYENKGPTNGHYEFSILLNWDEVANDREKDFRYSYLWTDGQWRDHKVFSILPPCTFFNSLDAAIALLKEQGIDTTREEIEEAARYNQG